jgi:hypothetical protein
MFGKLQEHYNYLQITQITKYLQKLLKCPNMVWLGVGNVKFKLIKFIRKDLFPEKNPSF